MITDCEYHLIVPDSDIIEGMVLQIYAPKMNITLLNYYLGLINSKGHSFQCSFPLKAVDLVHTLAPIPKERHFNSYTTSTFNIDKVDI